MRSGADSNLEYCLRAYRAAFPRAAFHLTHGFAASVILDLVLRLRPDILVLGKHSGTSTAERVLDSVTQFPALRKPPDLMLVP